MTINESSKNWYTIRSKPNKEFALERELIARNFNVMFPQLFVKPVNPRSRKIVPYFPGYMFIHVNLEKTGIRPLNRIPQSIGLVMFDDYVPVVSEQLIVQLENKLRAIAEAGGVFFENLHPGDPIEIVSGAFAGYQGIFEERLSGADRVRILLKMLADRYIPMEIDPSAILKID